MSELRNISSRLRVIDLAKVISTTADQKNRIQSIANQQTNKATSKQTNKQRDSNEFKCIEMTRMSSATLLHIGMHRIINEFINSQSMRVTNQLIRNKSRSECWLARRWLVTGWLLNRYRRHHINQINENDQMRFNSIVNAIVISRLLRP